MFTWGYDIGYRLNLASLLGLLAKIMCSICSCQLNIWHARHSLAPILNWFLTIDHGNEACFSLITDCPGLALPPGTVHHHIQIDSPRSQVNKPKPIMAIFIDWSDKKEWLCPTGLWYNHTFFLYFSYKQIFRAFLLHIWNLRWILRLLSYFPAF